jgi:hypothetical protein
VQKGKAWAVLHFAGNYTTDTFHGGVLVPEGAECGLLHIAYQDKSLTLA